MAQATIGALRVVLGLDSANFTKGLRSAQSSLKRVGKQMQSIGRTMSLAVTLPIVLMGRSILKAASDFEAGMNRVRGILKPTGEDFEKLTKLAKELGVTTQFTATQAAEGMEILAKNSLKTTQILGGAIQASLDLSGALGGDLADSADVITDLMVNFGLSASDLGDVVDGVTGSVLSSKLGWEDFAAAIGSAAGVAGPFGVALEDMNAVLAITATSFKSGEEVGTSFRGFLQNLVPKAGKAAAMMKKLGLEFFTASGDLKTMAEVAEELKVAFVGLTVEAKIQASTVLFGARRFKTAIRLAEVGAKGIDEIKEAIEQFSASEQRIIRLKGFSGSMLKLTSALEGLKLAIAAAGFLKFMTDIAKSLTGMVRSLAETSPALLMWGTIIAGLAAVAGPLVFTLGMMTTGFVALAPVIAAVRTAMFAMLGPWGLVAAAVVLVIVKFDALRDTFREFFPEATKFLEAYSRAIIDNTRLLLQWLGVMARPVELQISRLVEEYKEQEAGLALVTEQFKKAIASGVDFDTALALSTQRGRVYADRLREITIEIGRLSEKTDILTGAVELPEIEGIGEIAEAVKLLGLESEDGAKEVERLKDVFNDIIANLRDEAAGLQLRTKLIGMNIRDAAELVSITEAMNDAVREGLKLSPDQIVELKKFAAAVGEAADELKKRFDEERLFQGITDDITGPLRDALKEGEINFQSFADTLVSIASKLRDRLMQELFKPIEDALFDLLSSKGTSGGGGGILGNILGSIGSAIAGAFGSGGTGFVPPTGASLSAGPFQHGGSFTVGGGPGVDRNLVAFTATRGERVEITPANKTGKPAVSHGAESSGSNVEVNIFAPPGSDVREERNAIGDTEQINVFIDNAVAQNLSRPGTATFRALTSTHGTRQQLVRR